METKVLTEEFFVKETYSSRKEFDNLLFKNLIKDFKETDYSKTMNAYNLTDDAEKFAKALLQLKEFKELADEMFKSNNQMSAFNVISLLDDYFFNGPGDEEIAKMKAYIKSLD